MSEPYIGQQRTRWSEMEYEDIAEVFTDRGWVRDGRDSISAKHTTEELVDKLIERGYKVTLEKL